MAIALTSYLQRAKEISYQTRTNILKIVHQAKGGHLGGSLSVTDILSAIYSFDNFNDFEVILSKGHCLLAWICVLHEIGEIKKEELFDYYTNGARFAGHPKKGSSKSITWGTGSLGHGLSICCGKALANPNKKYFCILGDGETNEGSIWEAFMFLSQHKITNIMVIIDNNKQESLDRTCNILSIENLDKRFSGFNFNSSRINGHDLESLVSQFYTFLSSTYELPTVIIADTIKGKGVSFMEGVPMWHHRKLKDDELEQALSQLN